MDKKNNDSKIIHTGHIIELAIIVISLIACILVGIYAIRFIVIPMTVCVFSSMFTCIDISWTKKMEEYEKQQEEKPKKMKTIAEIKKFLEEELKSCNTQLTPLDKATFGNIDEFEEEEMYKFAKIEGQRNMIKYILEFIEE